MNRKQLVGLSYGAEDLAPLVVVKAAGADAEAIVSNAQAEGVLPIVRDPALVNQLYRVPMESPIGRELFPVMAVLLAHVLRLDREVSQESR